MLPATLATRGRAVARGYGELLMLNPGVPALTAYRYSPYTVPSSAAAALAAVAASPASSASARAPPALPLSSLGLPASSKVSITSGNSLSKIIAQSPTAQLQQLQQQQLLANAATLGSAILTPTILNCVSNLTQSSQQPPSQQQQTPQSQQTPQQVASQMQQQVQAALQQQTQQMQQLQQFQIMNVDPNARFIQAAPGSVPSLAPQYATTLTNANGHSSAASAVQQAHAAFAAAASAASCKQRALTPAAAVASLGTAGGTNMDAAQAAGLSYSVNDLVNFQPLQPLEAGASYQVPVGL